MSVNNLEQWALIAEIIGAIGVIASLIYVAIQIRQNTVASLASAHHQYLITQSSTNHSITDNAEVCELIDRANKDYGSLTDAELIRLQFVFIEHFNQWQFAYATGQKSLLERQMWDTFTDGYTMVARDIPAFQRMWMVCRHAYEPGFRAHVDAAIAAPGKSNLFADIKQVESAS